MDIDAIKTTSNVLELPFQHPGEWALAMDSCRFLAAFIQKLRPDNVLEFGSGLSTIVVANELEKLKQGTIETIDNSKHWSRLAFNEASKFNLTHRINFSVFELGMRIYQKQSYISYKIPEAFYFPSKKYDLVIIDAPHQDVGRDGVLFESFIHTKIGGYLFCDDCNNFMKHTLPRWQARFPQSIKTKLYEDVGNGIGIIHKVSERAAEPLFQWNQFVTGWMRSLRNYMRIGRLGLNDS